MRFAALFSSLWFAAVAVHAETRYVTDQFEIMMRSGESTQHSIVRMLPSGAPMEVLATNAETGYSHVRLPSGAEGYVLTRFLMPERASREQLAELRNRLARADSEQGGLSRQVDELVQQLSAAEKRIAELSEDNGRLATELQRIERISQNAVRLDESNRALTSQLAAGEQRIAELVDENEHLQRQSTRKWFLTGAAVVLFSMLFGITLTRVRWRKRSSWSDF